jgi:hypothetical protein
MEITCPECRSGVNFSAAFDAAYCWAGTEAAVAFKCPFCGGSAYFLPRENELEVGFLGASSTLDAIPMSSYQLHVAVNRLGQALTIEFEGKQRSLPSAFDLMSRGKSGKSPKP